MQQLHVLANWRPANLRTRVPSKICDNGSHSLTPVWNSQKIPDFHEAKERYLPVQGPESHLNYPNMITRFAVRDCQAKTNLEIKCWNFTFLKFTLIFCYISGGNWKWEWNCYSPTISKTDPWHPYQLPGDVKSYSLGRFLTKNHLKI